MFDHEIDQNESFSFDDITKDHFAVLGTTQPILIMNPCDLTQRNFLSNRRNSDNPYIEKADEALELQINLFHNLKIANVDLKQQQRKHKLKGANSGKIRRKTEVAS